MTAGAGDVGPQGHVPADRPRDPVAAEEPARREAPAVRLAGPGCPAPLGATPTAGGASFALLAPRATAAWLVVWPHGRDGEWVELALDPDCHRTGDVWHAEVTGVAPPLEYGWRLAAAAGAGSSGIDPRRLLLDPHGRAVSGGEQWGVAARQRRSLLLPRLPLPAAAERPRVAADRRVLYELGVRGFTAHPSARVAAPGTFRGLLQFARTSWEGVGGTGDPAEASYEEQVWRGHLLQLEQGWGAWPVCSRKAGLR